MTKNRKIELLINDKKRMMEENKRLHELSDEELRKRMTTELDRYSDIIENLYKKYAEFTKLKVIGIRNQWKYRVMLIGLKVRRILGI